jgi:hypothetical protein
MKVMHLHSKARGGIEENNAVRLLPKEERQGTKWGFGHRSSKQAGKYRRGKVIGMWHSFVKLLTSHLGFLLLKPPSN